MRLSLFDAASIKWVYSMGQNHDVGKLPPDILKSQVLRYSGAPRPEVLIGPGLGEDAALIRWGDEPYLVAASDPVVGAIEGAGRLLVHINANDVACKGGDPLWFVPTLIVPTDAGTQCVGRIMQEIHDTCVALNIAVVGGHTEMTDRYDRPVIVGTMMGPSRYDLRADKIRKGDLLIATKHVGLEGMSILAHDRPDLLSFLTVEELEEVRCWQNDLSILKEARLLRDLARYMHDPTEGGLEGGLLEIRNACGLGIAINLDDVPLSPITRKAAKELAFDPLHLISSGVLVAVVAPEDGEAALSRLEGEGVHSKIIGHFIEPRGECKSDMHEELWGILGRPNIKIGR